MSIYYAVSHGKIVTVDVLILVLLFMSIMVTSGYRPFCRPCCVTDNILEINHRFENGAAIFSSFCQYPGSTKSEINYTLSAVFSSSIYSSF